jgi:hypothetical protein
MFNFRAQTNEYFVISCRINSDEGQPLLHYVINIIGGKEVVEDDALHKYKCHSEADILIWKHVHIIFIPQMRAGFVIS